MSYKKKKKTDIKGIQTFDVSQVDIHSKMATSAQNIKNETSRELIKVQIMYCLDVLS